MSDARLEAAVEAAAKALHEKCREKRMLHWETYSDDGRDGMRLFVRPMVEAALEAADAYQKPKSEEPR